MELFRASVAQLAGRRSHNPKVVSSSLTGSIRNLFHFLSFFLSKVLQINFVIDYLEFLKYSIYFAKRIFESNNMDFTLLHVARVPSLKVFVGRRPDVQHPFAFFPMYYILRASGQRKTFCRRAHKLLCWPIGCWRRRHALDDAKGSRKRSFINSARLRKRGRRGVVFISTSGKAIKRRWMEKGTLPCGFKRV